jgi:serine/threonine protein kinase
VSNVSSLIDPLIGQTLVERYRLQRKIGEGGMGAVYEAVHIQLEKPVAVKVLRDQYRDRPEAAQRLVKEARLASSIRNEHIIEITDSGSTSDGRTFVVMEHLEGRSLAELIRSEGALPESRAIAIVLQAAVALRAAHDRGIIHRDVKPENIFLIERQGSRDFVKVVDFGISKSVHEEIDQLRLTQTGMVLGTPLYMSPEQARGEDDLDHRVDIYALGVILFEALTGEVPFRGANSLGIISQILNREPPRPRALRSDLVISEGVDEVVMRAITKPRELRYSTMAALSADLERALAGDWVKISPASTTPPAAARSKRRAVQVVLASTAALVGVGALWFGLREVRERPTVPSTPPLAKVGSSNPSTPSELVGAAATTVVVHVESQPDGAEVRQGPRVLGTAPGDLVLPRSYTSVPLTFVHEGYESSTVQVTPSTDDTVSVQLRPHTSANASANASGRYRTRRALLMPRKMSVAADVQGAPDRRPGGASETLPNPY